MQLKLRRSQREGGVISKNVIFCLDTRVDFTSEEKANIRRYKLHNQVIYNSDAQKQLLDRSKASRDGSFGGDLRSLAWVAFAATKLHVTVTSLERGQHIECKSLDELLGAEEAVMTACQNLKGYLEVAATFDGRELVIDFDGEGSRVAAQPQPQPQPPQLPVAGPAPTAVGPQAAPLTAAPAGAVREAPAEVEPEVLVETAQEALAEAIQEAPIPDPPTTEAGLTDYAPIESGGFFSEGPEGENEKRILIGVGAGLIFLFLLVAIL